MRLYIVRHGKATEDPAPQGQYPRPEGYPPDFDRALAPRGEAQAKYLGEELAGEDRRVGFVLTSRYPRAIRTAEIISTALNADMKPARELEVDHPVSEAIGLINEHRGLRGMMIVGHNPQLSELLGVLCAGLPPQQMMLRTGELVGLEVRPNQIVGGSRVIMRLRLGDEHVGAGPADIATVMLRGA